MDNFQMLQRTAVKLTMIRATLYVRNPQKHDDYALVRFDVSEDSINDKE